MADDVTERRPAAVPPAETPGLSGLLTLAVGVVVVAGLYLGRTVLIPITLAVLLSFMLAPLVNLLRRIHLGRVPSALLAVVLALSVILAIGGLIGTQLADLAQQVPIYAQTIRKKVEMVQNFALNKADVIIGRLGQQLNAPAPQQKKAPAGTEQKPLPVEIHQPE